MEFTPDLVTDAVNSPGEGPSSQIMFGGNVLACRKIRVRMPKSNIHFSSTSIAEHISRAFGQKSSFEKSSIVDIAGLMVEGGGTHDLTIPLCMSGSCFCLSSIRTCDLWICRPKR